MNEWLEDILEKPRSQKLIYLGAVCAAVWGLMWMVVLGGQWNKASTLSQETQQQHERLARLRERAANLGNVRKMVSELDRQLNAALERLPDRREIPALLNNISELASASGLRITKFRQRAEIMKDYYAEVPVELSMRGSFHQIASFFSRVPRLDRLVNVSAISMKKPAIIAEDVQVEASCLATTFRFLDEEERERAAKEREKKKGGKRI